MEDRMGFGILRRRREEREMMLTELGGGWTSPSPTCRACPWTTILRRLPPDLFSRIDQVIAVYRLHAAGRRL